MAGTSMLTESPCESPILWGRAVQMIHKLIPQRIPMR